MNDYIMFDCFNDALLSMVNASVQYWVMHCSCIFDTQVNASVMLDSFKYEILSFVNSTDQYLDLPWSYTFDTQMNALYYNWLFYWCICEGNVKLGSALLKQSIAWSSSKHLFDLFDTFELDKQKLSWALRLTLYISIAQKQYIACFF